MKETMQQVLVKPNTNIDAGPRNAWNNFFKPADLKFEVYYADGTSLHISRLLQKCIHDSSSNQAMM